MYSDLLGPIFFMQSLTVLLPKRAANFFTKQWVGLCTICIQEYILQIHMDVSRNWARDDLNEHTLRKCEAPPKKFIMPTYKIKCHHNKFWSSVLKDENLSKNLRLSQATWITFSCCFRTTNIKIFNPLACNNVPDVWSY